MGSHWVEEGLAAYLGFELRTAYNIKDAGKYFNDSLLYKPKLFTQQMIAFANFTGALITYLTMQNSLPTDLKINGGELPFFLAPTLQVAGLMCLMVTSKPPKSALND